MSFWAKPNFFLPATLIMASLHQLRADAQAPLCTADVGVAMSFVCAVGKHHVLPYTHLLNMVFSSLHMSHSYSNPGQDPDRLVAATLRDHNMNVNIVPGLLLQTVHGMHHRHCFVALLVSCAGMPAVPFGPAHGLSTMWC